MNKKRLGCLALSGMLLVSALFGAVQATCGGTVVSYGSQTNTVSLSLLSGDKVAYSVTVTGNQASYDFGNVPPGSYTLRAEKALHVTREYEITVGTSWIGQNVQLLQLGDVTQDGKVNIGDTARMYAHVRGTNKLTDSYVLSCADITGDRRLNVGDVARSYGNLRNPVSAQLYTVAFKDFDGALLKTQIVESGKSVTPPADPERSGYTFSGWDKSFDKITENLTVSAQYSVSIQGAAFTVGHIVGAPGQTVRVPVSIVNNPGVAGARITVSYDSALTLSAAEVGEAFSDLQHTGPGRYVSPCNFTWDSESGMATADGTVLTLSFSIPEDAASGDVYDITCTYREGDIYDEALNDVSFEMLSGTITVE